MFCKKCGKELSDDTVFCPACGQKTDSQQNESTVVITAEKQVNMINAAGGFPVIAETKRQLTSDEAYCRSCGNIIRKEAELCPKCGVNRTKPIMSEEVYCHSCGERIKNAAEICPKCGVRQLKYGGASAIEAQHTPGKKFRALIVLSIIGIVFSGSFFLAASLDPDINDIAPGSITLFMYMIAHAIVALIQGNKHKINSMRIMSVLGMIFYVLSPIFIMIFYEDRLYDESLGWVVIGSCFALAASIAVLIMVLKNSRKNIA